jgi:FG-GAP-like repeat
LDVADVNQDGSLDLLLATRYDSSIYVMLNRGDGTFEDPFTRDRPTGKQLVQLHTTDLDNDDYVDIVYLLNR